MYPQVTAVELDTELAIGHVSCQHPAVLGEAIGRMHRHHHLADPERGRSLPIRLARPCQTSVASPHAVPRSTTDAGGSLTQVRAHPRAVLFQPYPLLGQEHRRKPTRVPELLVHLPFHLRMSTSARTMN